MVYKRLLRVFPCFDAVLEKSSPNEAGVAASLHPRKAPGSSQSPGRPTGTLHTSGSARPFRCGALQALDPPSCKKVGRNQPQEKATSVGTLNRLSF